jgi:hypothetical protein
VELAEIKSRDFKHAECAGESALEEFSEMVQGYGPGSLASLSIANQGSVSAFKFFSVGMAWCCSEWTRSLM